MTRRALVVCTANVCRSPSVQGLLQRRLEGRRDVDGEVWTVRSAGTSAVVAPPDPHTIAAAASHGVDLSAHESRHLDREILARDGADLVLTMTRAHLRHVVALDPAWWPRTFTLKELARRAEQIGPADTSDGFEGWRRRVHAGRRPATMIVAHPLDDVADPYGAPRREHDAMFAEIEVLVDRLIRYGPWAIGASGLSRK